MTHLNKQRKIELLKVEDRKIVLPPHHDQERELNSRGWKILDKYLGFLKQVVEFEIDKKKALYRILRHVHALAYFEVG